MHTGTLSIRAMFGFDRRHVVPLFQRPYVWKRETQWEPFWEDIRAVAERLLLKQPTPPHFLGAIVLDQLPTGSTHLDTRQVIDGQQRLTTIQVFLEAFCDLCGALENEKYRKALWKLTRNDDPMSVDPDEQFKVWPTNVDQEHFRRVMLVESPEELRAKYGGKPNADEVGHPIADAYLYFYKSITEWLAPDDGGFAERLESLYTACGDYVRLVTIDLEREDDAQLIFETLNARGTPLLPSDLVKNFLFHRAQSEGGSLDRLYGEYWKPFEYPDSQRKYWHTELGRGHARRARIDIFLHHYLTLKLGDEPGVTHLYQAFRKYFLDGTNRCARTMLTSIREYAEIYQSFDQKAEDSPEGVFFCRLAMMEITTAYPFLLELFARHGSDCPEIRTILKDLESFLVRRMVCQLSTRGYNRLFIDLVNVLGSDSGTPAPRVRAYLLSSDAESNRWPKDAEFKAAWLTVPVFRTLVRQRVRMLLESLESQLYTEMSEQVKIVQKLTIEHLMPQQWHANWPLPEGTPRAEAELHREQAIHTLGNLTLLTGKLNTSVSNGDWENKRRAMMPHTVLRLNQFLHKATEWDEKMIQERGEQSFKLAGRIWPHPAA